MTDGDPAADDRAILRRGFSLLWASARAQRRPFAISVAGASLFAVVTVGGTIVLGRVTDRVLAPADQLFTHGEPDQLAVTTMAVLRRGVLPLSVVEPWIARIAAAAGTLASYDDRDPYLTSGNAESFLRSLYLQLSLAAQPPALRSDLLLTLVEALRSTNAQYLHPDYLHPVR